MADRGARALHQTGFSTTTLASPDELSLRDRFLDTFDRCPIPRTELLQNLALFLNRKDLARVIFLNELYQHILEVDGIIVEFGVRWGRDLAVFEALRGMYEPFNYGRKIVGFDTFEGLTSPDPDKDTGLRGSDAGAYSVTGGYEDYLESVLTYHERESPLPHITKYELVKGDVRYTIHDYLDRHPETVIALAYFDLDLYEPTRDCLRAIEDCLPKGAVIGFDEVNCPEFPGETRALKEVFGLGRYRLRRSRVPGGHPAFLVLE